jgi:hypothetical protein
MSDTPLQDAARRSRKRAGVASPPELNAMPAAAREAVEKHLDANPPRNVTDRIVIAKWLYELAQRVANNPDVPEDERENARDIIQRLQKEGLANAD